MFDLTPLIESLKPEMLTALSSTAKQAAEGFIEPEIDGLAGALIVTRGRKAVGPSTAATFDGWVINSRW